MSKEYSLIGDDGESVIDIALGDGVVDISDGYHTFGELYEHRLALTAVVASWAAQRPEPAAWRSKAHHPDDSPMFEGGYFIVGIELDTGPITYHYKLPHWDDFAAVPELDHAPKWDGATPGDTVTRLLGLARLMAQVPLVVPQGKTDWAQTARDLTSGIQERADSHLQVVDNRIGSNFGRPIKDRPQA